MIRTVGDLIAELQKLDGSLPVARLTYDPERTVAGTLSVSVKTLRAQCAAQLDSFVTADGTPVPFWFALGSAAALYHEERGAGLQQVAVIEQGS